MIELGSYPPLHEERHEVADRRSSEVGELAADSCTDRRARVGIVEAIRQTFGHVDRSVPWAQRRSHFIAGLGVTVELARDQLHQALNEGRARDARDLSVTLGILADKAELLSGGATSRSESYSVRGDMDFEAMRAEVAANERKLAELTAGGE